MEENKLEVNEKLFAFNGIIGRHAYFVNIVILCALSIIVVSPYTTYFYANAGTISDMLDIQKMFLNTPLILKLWMIIGTAGVCTLSVSNIFRRLNDILGKVQTGTNIIFSTISVLASFSFLIPLKTAFLLLFVNFILAMFLLFKRGKITNTLPYDYKKEFNWGAFFGTWIWGLFNKSYIPLWELLLWITPLGFYFQLYCGLKGNEWAYKNKGCTDVKAFNKSQETQALVFIILNLVIIPILYVVLVLGFVILIAFIAGDSANQPNVNSNDVKQESSIDKLMSGFTSLYFERYEFTSYENKFYVLDDDWQNADFQEKKNMLDFAASKSANERSREFKKQHPDRSHYFSKTRELPRTKIYSATSGKLLGEFVISENEMNGSFTEAFKAALNAYRFYKP